MSWTQPVCRSHWWEHNPGRDPHRVIEQFAEQETCCFCGHPTTSGIYMRVDPKTVPYPA